MKIKLLLGLLLFFNLNIHANEYWKKDYSKVDSFALTVKSTPNLEKLAAKLTSNYTSDLEKYRSIFTWITHNIAYDCAALKKPSLRVTDPVQVIRHRKTICSGYCNLFSNMCELSGLECKTIKGWDKPKEKIGGSLNDNPTHSWNAIKIGNNWFLCDVTWGAGSTNEDNVFNFEFKDFYFCTPPELFVYNHFPEKEEWLFGAVLSKNKFIETPHFYPTAIKSNIKNLYPEKGNIEFKKGNIVEFRFALDEKIERITIKPSNSKKSKQVEYSIKNGFIEFKYLLEEYSPFLYIYLNNKAFLVYKMSK